MWEVKQMKALGDSTSFLGQMDDWSNKMFHLLGECHEELASPTAGQLEPASSRRPRAAKARPQCFILGHLYRWN